MGSELAYKRIPRTCKVDIQSFSALPRFDNPGAKGNGPGKSGTRSDPAKAVVGSTLARIKAPHLRHVINISAGWEPLTGCMEAPLPADVEEVKDAFELAFCSGAPVFVASGKSAAARQR